jgi:CheY-like chemotaxis protein
MTCELKELERANGGAATSRRPGILIVDDLGLILSLLKLELEPRGFRVWLGMDGRDAIDLYRKHAPQIDVVLLDVRMPGLDGLQTLAALQEIDPDVLACFMTGDSGTYTETELLARGADQVFVKPFHPSDIADSLQALVDLALEVSGSPVEQRGRGRFISSHLPA